MTQERSGANILVESLVRQGVEFVFGYPGGAVLPIYDELFGDDRIRHILVRHEAGAAHAAEGYARSTGKPGVVLVTSGPGATNAVTGIADAFLDSIPMVVITGQVATNLIGSDAFQEADTIGITRHCTKHNYLVRDPAELAATIDEAFEIATTGRPGPVVIDIPKNVQVATALFNDSKPQRPQRYNPRLAAENDEIARAIDLIANAKAPILYTGGGIINSGPRASELLRQFQALTGAPVTSTLMGLGAFPADHSDWLGMLGMHGTLEANMAVQSCDVLLAIGARFDDRVIGDPEHFYSSPRKIVHVDIDPSSISKRVRVDVPVVGNVKDVLAEMLRLLDEQTGLPDITEWWQEIAEWRSKECLKYAMKQEIMPQYVIEKLHEVTGGQAVVTSDVGQHQMWAAQYYGFDKPRRWANSGGLGTMGVGLPYAMGAAFANPDSPIVCITGDGSIQMCLQELATAKQYGLPIKVICLNNHYLGMVRQWQELFYGRRYSHTCMKGQPDFIKIAEAYGHVGIRVEKPEDVEPALRKAFTDHKDDLVFLDIRTSREANVFPMVAAGKGLSEIILSELI